MSSDRQLVFFAGARVVNLRHERYDVYIGRAGRGEDGNFGNPFDPREYGRWALVFFRRYFEKRIRSDPDFRRRVEGLRGKTLGCFCKDARGKGLCHGDVYVEWLERKDGEW